MDISGQSQLNVVPQNTCQCCQLTLCHCNQVDTYGLCVVVHMMLHGSYMEVEKKASSDGSFIYLPKSSFRR